jgi:CheY-like chemotaxis protein
MQPPKRIASRACGGIASGKTTGGIEVSAQIGENPISPIGVCGSLLTMVGRRGKTFLVIEDCSDDAILIGRAFSATANCQAVVCRNLGEARAYLRGVGIYHDRSKFPFPNAIISDLHLESESGFDFLKWVKGTAEFKDMPVTILTDVATPEECLRCKEAGALRVLTKPNSYDALKTMLADLAAKLCG